ncbi:MAG: 3'-5' exonuclease [Rhodobacterales bacterium]|nr:3'-5' exonuclease [Rhodobacterales bacterium]
MKSSAARPLTCDFDLLGSTRSATLRDIPPRDLVCNVFDSETTGLNPASDEVVQLGAVRIVNSRIVPGEVSDTLVNPGGPIPKSSIAVHGIDNAMVAGAPCFGDVCLQSHEIPRRLRITPLLISPF